MIEFSLQPLPYEMTMQNYKVGKRPLDDPFYVTVLELNAENDILVFMNL
jgi:hypothetical protein